jgi:hypothetical protein
MVIYKPSNTHIAPNPHVPGGNLHVIKKASGDTTIIYGHTVAFSQESFSSMCCPCICDTCHGHVRDVHTCEQIPHCTEGRAHHSTLCALHQASQPQNRISCIKTTLTYSATSFGNFIAFDYSVVLSSG